MACLQGIQTVVDLGIGHMVIQAIMTNDFDASAVQLLVARIWCPLVSLVLSAFPNVENVTKLLMSLLCWVCVVIRVVSTL